MSTRGTIAIKDKSGYVLGIYLHGDSYLDNAGEILLKGFSTLEKVTDLIKHGACSVLHENIGEQHDFEDWEFFYNNRQCKFYHRDRGERFEIFKAKSVQEFYDNYSESNDYLFDDGIWYVRTFELEDDKYDELMIPLTEALELFHEQEKRRKLQEALKNGICTDSE